MRYGLMGTLMSVYILLQMFFGGLQGIDAVGGGALNDVVQAREFNTEVSPGNPISWIGTTQDFFSRSLEVVSWDYPYFEGDWNYLRQILLTYTFVVGLMLVVHLGPIVLSGIATLRSLLPF